MQIIRIPTNQEYDILVDITCGDNAKMHWHDMFSWTNDEKGKYDLPSSRRVVRGYYSARGWNGYYATSQGMYVGFRPAVDILGTDALASDLKEGATTVMGTLYMNGEPVRVPQDPVCSGDVTKYKPGALLEMRKALDNPTYQVTGICVGNAIISDRVLVNMISYEEAERSTVHSPTNKVTAPDIPGCRFCSVSYIPGATYVADREQHEEVVAGCWTSLLRGVDERGRVFVVASGEDDSDRYYPKFCPECGRRLEKT